MKAERVAVVPCSGIGKAYGTVSREAAYEVVEDLLPESTELVALSLLVLGDETARSAVTGVPTVAIDGCKLACATKMVEESGGRVARTFQVMDTYRRHRELKPQGISELNQAGRKLAEILAAEIAEAVDSLPAAGPADAPERGAADA
jgi:uncharacterized metal-binding protein